MMHTRIRYTAALVLYAFAIILLGGCRMYSPAGTIDSLTGESYPDAEKYQTGAFTYAAEEIKAVEVYWRSGEITITESDSAELRVMESGSELAENAAMHYLLDDGVLRIRFCASGARIQVNTMDKHLRLEIPKEIDLSVHTTSAHTKAATLNQKDVLFAALSGDTELGTVTAENVDVSSSAGDICADSIAAQSLKCQASSGSVHFGTVSAKTIDCGTSSGDVSIDGITAETLAVIASSGNVKLSPADLLYAEIHTSSGEVNLTLPKNGASVLYTATSGEILTDCAYERMGDLYVFGSGKTKLSVTTASGNLKIQ